MVVIQELREDIPQNTILGRNNPGTGDWEVLTPKELAQILFSYKNPGAGKFLSPAVNSLGLAGVAGVIPLNTLRAYSWDFDYPVVVNQIEARITTAGAVGTQARVAIYADSGANYPGAKIAATELTLNGTLVTPQSLSFASAELYGRVWVVYNGFVALAAMGLPVGAMNSAQGVTTGLAVNPQRTVLTLANAFGVLPPTFPAGATPLANTSGLLVALRTA